MNQKVIAIASAAAFLCAVVIAVLRYELLIVTCAWRKISSESRVATNAQKKKISLYFWRNDRWKQEYTQLVVPEHQEVLVARITRAWLHLLEEEGVTKKKVGVEAVLTASRDQEVYISLDRSLFDKEATTFEKWMLIEGLLKTLRENGVTAQRIFFQMHYQPMHDYHLDFSNAWPIAGYIK